MGLRLLLDDIVNIFYKLLIKLQVKQERPFFFALLGEFIFDRL
jgi:hypothetical protein